MPPFAARVIGTCLAASLVAAVAHSALAQAGAGGSSSFTTPSICSSGGCLPRMGCQDGTELCSAFPEHPAYDPNVEFRQGVAALKAGDYKGAQRAFDKVLYLAPTNSDVLYALGLADVRLGDLAGGASAFERALKWNPRQINAARELALTDLKLGQKEKAALQLASLKTRAAKCGDRCREAADLKDAISAIETVLTPTGDP